MKAVFINVAEKMVTTIEIANKLHAFYEKIRCRAIETVNLGMNQILIVDEEGRLKKEVSGFFKFKNNSLIIAGNALIVSSDSDGDFTDAGVSTEKVSGMIEFLDLKPEDLPPPRFIMISIDNRSGK